MRTKIIVKIILIMFIILIISLVIVLNIKKEETHDVFVEISDEYVEYSKEIEEVTSYMTYDTVKNCINKYFKKIYYAKNTDLIEDINNQETNEEKRTAIYNMLYIPYIQKNGVTEKNVLTKVHDVQEKYVMEILDIKIIKDEKIQTYYVCGQINEGEKLFLVVYIDQINATFAIQPLTEQYDDIKEINIENEVTKIAKNYKNNVIYSRLDEQGICRKYLLNYKTKLQTNIEEAYELLDERYKEKRFNTIDDFKEYVDDSLEIIESITLKSYRVNQYSDHKEYICQDALGNYYIFNIKSVLDYSVKLDICTIIDNFEEKYENLDEPNRVALNIERVFQMINARDYKNVYYLLDEQFRNNQFGSYKQFKKYAKNNFYIVNSINYLKYDKINDLYVYDIEITDKTGKNLEKIEKTIIMKLDEGTDFVMSFNIE